MKTKALSLTFCLLSISLVAFCVRPTEEVKRIIRQNYSTTHDSYYLKVENLYGKITIVEWNKPEIDFSIEIIGKGENPEIAQTMADWVSVDFHQSGNRISAQTIFESQIFRCKNCKSTVNYTISVPSNIYFNLTNKYGNIYLETAHHDFTAQVKYGKLTIQQLQGNKNNITIKYGDLKLQSAGKLNLEISYSHAVIDTVETLSLHSGYSSLKSDKISTFTLESPYDKFTIANLGEASAMSAYSEFNIGYLAESLRISELRYGKVHIENLCPDFKIVDISASYSPVYIGMPANNEYNFKAELSAHYGRIKTDNFTFNNVQLSDKDRSTSSIKGTVGRDSDALIRISNNYSDIIFGR